MDDSLTHTDKTPCSLRLLVITTDADCLAWVKQVYAAQREASIWCLGYRNLEECLLANGSRALVEADVLIVDLCYASHAPSRFWIITRLIYDQTPIVAVARPETLPDTVGAALHARVEQFIQLHSPSCEMQEAVWRAYTRNTTFGYLPVLESVQSVLRQPAVLGLDLQRRKVHVHGTCIHLSDHEAQLLAYLAAQAGRPVGWRELLGAVWQTPVEKGGTRDQVKSAIKRLRQRIELQPTAPQYILSQDSGYCAVNVKVMPEPGQVDTD